MSYPQGLDEYPDPEVDLVQEIGRRRALCETGQCQYCRRAGDTASCRFPQRHEQARLYLERMRGNPIPKEPT